MNASRKLILSMSQFNFILSPLDQFEVRDLFSLNANILGNLHLSLTNIGLFFWRSLLLKFKVPELESNFNFLYSSIIEPTFSKSIGRVLSEYLHKKL